MVTDPSPAMSDLPTLIFAMRYSNAVGFVHNSMGRIYDRVAQLLRDDFCCLLAYPELSTAPAFEPQHLKTIEADFYDATASNLVKLRSVVLRHRAALIAYMGFAEINQRFLHRLGVCTIGYIHDSFPSDLSQSHSKKLAKRIMRRWLKWNLHDLYLANAQHQRNFLLSYAQLPENRVITIRNGVDVAYFSPGPPPPASELQVPTTQYYALTICQARPEKRIDILIDAAAQVFSRRPDLPITFLHVGSGQCLEAWRRRVEGSGIGQRFCFLGYKNDVLPYLRLCSFYVHSAERESFGLAIAEAMACGKPVICSDARGPQELVEDGITGFLIRQGKVESFADAILAMADDPALVQRMGLAARERAVTRFSLDRQAAEMANLVRRMRRTDGSASQPRSE